MLWKQLLATLSCCMSGSFNGTKKWVHSLPAKIDKCKKQVGIQDGSLSKRTHVALKATTKPSNSAFGWLANTTQNAMRSVQPEGMVEDHKCSQTLLPLSEVSEHGPDSCRCFSTSFLSSYYSINSSLSPTGTKEHFITVLFAIICIFSVS